MSKHQSFEMDIAQEFRDVKKTITESNAAVNERISILANEINAQNRLFERELTKLNQNMENCLKTLSEHEYRISQLETKTTISEAKTKTISEMVKAGWFLGKFILAAGIVMGGILGTAKAWTIIFS